MIMPTAITKTVRQIGIDMYTASKLCVTSCRDDVTGGVVMTSYSSSGTISETSPVRTVKRPVHVYKIKYLTLIMPKLHHLVMS